MSPSFSKEEDELSVLAPVARIGRYHFTTFVCFRELYFFLGCGAGEGDSFSQDLSALALYLKSFPETQRHGFFLCALTAEALGSGEGWVAESLEVVACVFASRDLLKQGTC